MDKWPCGDPSHRRFLLHRVENVPLQWLLIPSLGIHWLDRLWTLVWDSLAWTWWLLVSREFEPTLAKAVLYSDLCYQLGAKCSPTWDFLRFGKFYYLFYSYVGIFYSVLKDSNFFVGFSFVIIVGCSKWNLIENSSHKLGKDTFKQLGVCLLFCFCFFTFSLISAVLFC